MGLDAIVAPLFIINPVAWSAPPPDEYDALLLTSANAPRHAGLRLARYAHLPCFVTGEATAQAALDAGLARVEAGPSDGMAALQLAAAAGHRRILHLAGRDHMALGSDRIAVDTHVVYASDQVGSLPEAASRAIETGAIVLLHSGRAAERLAGLLAQSGISRADVAIAAISRQAAEAAGPGWRDVAVAEAPRDQALLAIAAKLCQTAPGPERKSE